MHAMARARRLEDELRHAESLRHRSPGSDATQDIIAALAHRSGLVVGAAARAAHALRCDEALPAMLGALDGLYVDPADRDPKCHGKLALVTALDELGHADAAVFLRAVRHVQLEPVWGGQEDSAPPLRVRAAQALVRLGHHTLYRVLGDLLVDPVGDVRGAAAQMLGALGGERAALLLRLRVAVGEEPDRADVLADHLAGLLACDGEASLPLVTVLLTDADRSIASAAALALGGSRLPAALTPLHAALGRSIDRQLRRSQVDAIALLRSEAAVEVLLGLVAEGDQELAVHAAGALRLYRDRETVVRRTEAAIAIRGVAGIAKRWASAQPES
jgi:HEAT repeat protein